MKGSASVIFARDLEREDWEGELSMWRIVHEEFRASS
jgi:hypothetical protein